jgi:uncharacterized protein YbjT (DUF2867 family)
MKLKVVITGATGMVGKGVLLECLDSENIDSVLLINRRSIDIKHKKLKEIVHQDFYDLSSIEDQLKGYDACFFCLGISAYRMSEEDYSKITYDLTLHFANTLLNLNPEMTFCYVSGQGTDSTEKSRMMWANVKGKTENALLRLPFKKAYMFRPGFIQPMRGIKSSTKMYNTMYTLIKPLMPVLKLLFPKSITNTDRVGKAMINSVTIGYDKTHLDNQDINKLAES